MSEPQTMSDAVPETSAAPGDPVAEDAPAEAKQAPEIPNYDDDDADDSLFAEFLLFLKEEKKWWLAPLVILLVGLGAIVAFTEGSALAPFIYTVF